jgi:hypothetical protein
MPVPDEADANDCATSSELYIGVSVQLTVALGVAVIVTLLITSLKFAASLLATRTVRKIFGVMEISGATGVVAHFEIHTAPFHVSTHLLVVLTICSPSALPVLSALKALREASMIAEMPDVPAVPSIVSRCNCVSCGSRSPRVF